MKRPLAQRLRDFFGIAWVSRIGESPLEFYLPISVYKDSYKCHYCSNISPGKWCLHCDIHPARGTYYDECGHPCKPTARIRPISKADQAHTHTFPEGMYSHGRCYEKSQLDEGGNGMFKKAVYSREELIRVTEALDYLGKFYTVHKRDEGRPPGKFTPTTPDGKIAVVWYVTEVEPQSGAPSTVGDIEVKLTIDTTGLETAFKEVRQMLTRPLSDFVTVEVGEDSDEQARPEPLL